MLPLVFSHANSFPAATYRLLFALLRERGCEVRAVERFGHDPAYPVTDNWPHLVQQLADFTRAEVERLGEPVFLVGHSLGGFLSVMAAALHPELARGVLLIDSPLISGWRANALGMAKRTQLVGSVSPGKISQRRRHQWASNDEALDYFRAKKAFAQWHPAMLQDSRTTTASACWALTERSRPRSTTRCRTTSTRCCAAIRCAAPRLSSAAAARRK